MMEIETDEERRRRIREERSQKRDEKRKERRRRRQLEFEQEREQEQEQERGTTSLAATRTRLKGVVDDVSAADASSTMTLVASRSRSTRRRNIGSCNDDNDDTKIDDRKRRRKRERLISSYTSSRPISSSLSSSYLSSKPRSELTKEERLQRLKDEKELEEGKKLIREKYPTFYSSHNLDALLGDDDDDDPKRETQKEERRRRRRRRKRQLSDDSMQEFGMTGTSTANVNANANTRTSTSISARSIHASSPSNVSKLGFRKGGSGGVSILRKKSWGEGSDGSGVTSPLTQSPICSQSSRGHVHTHANGSQLSVQFKNDFTTHSTSAKDKLKPTKKNDDDDDFDWSVDALFAHSVKCKKKESQSQGLDRHDDAYVQGYKSPEPNNNDDGKKIPTAAQDTTPILTTARQEDDKGDTTTSSHNSHGFDDDLWEWVSKKQRQKEERGEATSATINQKEDDDNIHTGTGKGGDEDEDENHVNRDDEESIIRRRRRKSSKDKYSQEEDNDRKRIHESLRSMHRTVNDNEEDFWLDDSEIDRLNGKTNLESLAAAEDGDDDHVKAQGTSSNGRRGGRKGKSGKGMGTNKGKEKVRQKTYAAFDDDDFYDPDDMDMNDEEKLLQCLKPTFDNPKWPPTELVQFPLQRRVNPGEDPIIDYIPPSISRYIQDYQKEGVQFLHEIVTTGDGAVLGDDMGLGKTIQLIALIAALQQKTGTKVDLRDIKEREKYIDDKIEKLRENADDDLMWGRANIQESNVDVSKLDISRTPFSPILVIVPVSVVQNWENEFKTWGHFAVSSYTANTDKAIALRRVEIGKDDILLCSNSILKNDDHVKKLLTVQWQLIVIDEFHDYRIPTNKLYKAAKSLRNKALCPLIGLTGTLMSNKQTEIWTLIDLVQEGILGNKKEFKTDYGDPIKLARTKDAKPDVIELGRKRSKELNNILQHVYLERDKNIILEDYLPSKNQIVVFCELSDVQKKLYQHILDLPEYQLLRKSCTPCDCGVNRHFFANYKVLSKGKQRLEFWRRHKKEIVKRKHCCYRTCANEKSVLWDHQHPNGGECERCPTCIFFPAITFLSKVCSHASLIQARQHPDYAQSEKEKEQSQKEYDFARIAIPKNILPDLPGGTYIRKSSIEADHVKLSGKMKVLGKFLKKFEQEGDRVLLFSTSTTTLDFIEEFAKGRGYTHLRLDGRTPSKKRQGLVDKFQQEKDIFMFLISTKAGGVGLNLTAANRVVIYDVNWDPAHDEQAQDRAFRIGQEKNVDVIRLVAQGTIEELQYMRQIYKVHLKNQTLKSDEYTANEPARIFRGVDKDKNRKGELFGMENLLKFKDGSFMRDQWKATNQSLASGQMNEVADLPFPEEGVPENFEDEGFGDEMELLDEIEDCVNAFDEDRVNTSSQECDEMKGFHHDDFLRGDKGDAALQQGDEGYDVEMGGESQMAHLACDLACEDIDDSKNEDDEGDKKMLSVDKKIVETDDVCSSGKPTEDAHSPMLSDASAIGKAVEEALLLDLDNLDNVMGKLKGAETKSLLKSSPNISFEKTENNRFTVLERKSDIAAHQTKDSAPKKSVVNQKMASPIRKDSTPKKSAIMNQKLASSIRKDSAPKKRVVNQRLKTKKSKSGSKNTTSGKPPKFSLYKPGYHQRK